MKITTTITKHIAELSGLNLTEQETDSFTLSLSSIVDYIGTLAKLDTDGVEPLTHVLPERNRTRADSVNDSYDRTELIANAAKHTSEYVVVPKTFGEGGA